MPLSSIICLILFIHFYPLLWSYLHRLFVIYVVRFGLCLICISVRHFVTRPPLTFLIERLFAVFWLKLNYCSEIYYLLFSHKSANSRNVHCLHIKLVVTPAVAADLGFYSADELFYFLLPRGLYICSPKFLITEVFNFFNPSASKDHRLKTLILPTCRHSVTQGKNAHNDYLHAHHGAKSSFLQAGIGSGFPRCHLSGS